MNRTTLSKNGSRQVKEYIMFVERLSFTTLVGGRAHGAPVLELRVGDSSHPSLSNKKIRKEVLAAAENMRLKVRRLQLSFTAGGENDEGEVRELITVLKDHNFFIGVEVNGDTRPGFLDLANYITVYVNEPEWLNFKANEVFYIPVVEEELIEPEFSEWNVKNAFKYLFIKDRIEPKRLFTFLRESTYLWNVVYPLLRTYEIPFLGGKK